MKMGVVNLLAQVREKDNINKRENEKSLIYAVLSLR